MNAKWTAERSVRTDGQIYENAKRKDSSCTGAQIILNDNAKDKK